MHFEKGKSGNPATQFSKENQPENPGRPPILPDLNILLAKVLGKEKDGKTAAEAILSALQAKASKGDIRAAEVLMNRGYGFPKQHIDATTNGKDIVQQNLVFVDANNLTDDQIKKIMGSDSDNEQSAQ